MRVTVFDYGAGNLHSLVKALEGVDVAVRVETDPVRAVAGETDVLVLPGVGAFGACMAALRATGLEDPVLGAVESGRPFLAVCVGTQMLFDGSEEDRGARGLGVLPGTVEWIPPGVKRPQMQWNRIDAVDPHEPMFAGLGERPWFYFVHSLHGVPSDPSIVAATCEYGSRLNAAFRRGNVFAAQFHPEKSAAAGLGLLGNFVSSLSVPA